jgi:hypothetical protein
MFSFYYRSRLAFHLANGRFYGNEDVRSSGAGLTNDDGYRGSYSYVNIDRSPDTANTDFGTCPAGSAKPRGRHHRHHARRHHRHHRTHAGHHART